RARGRRHCCFSQYGRKTRIMRLLLAATVGFLVWWLYRSQQAREEIRQRLSAARASLRQATKTAASATAGRAERAAGGVAGAPLPHPLKATASRVTTTVRAAAGKAGGAVPGASHRTATVQLQELPSGSWVGDTAWGGRTLNEDGTEAQAVIHRLAAQLAALPGP